VYNKDLGEWTVRKQGEVIARMHMINPRNQELFHLRVLLINVKGALSFEHLRTVNDFTYSTFTQAAKALNLVDNDRQWYDFVEEVIQNETAFNARYSFTMMIIHCMPANPTAYELWEQFKLQLSADFIRLNKSETIGVQQGLQHIEHLCKSNGSSMAVVGLPEPDRRVQLFHMPVNPLENRTPEEYLAIGEEMKAMFYEEQLNAFNAIYDASLRYQDPQPKCFFVEGMGGSGKTHLIKVNKFIKIKIISENK
jgi:hypothetical protein